MADDQGRDEGASTAIRTVADLARLAGVTSGTVSRALANNKLVKPATREKIQALAREHGFRPNQMASKLRTQRTGVIGLVIPLGHDRKQHISDPFFMTLLGYLADALTECGYDLMLSRAIPQGDDEWLRRITGSGMVDGVIVIGQSDQLDVIEQVAGDYEPIVAWGDWRPGQRHCAVGTDNVAGGQMATQHLIDCGARHLAFLGDVAGIEIARRLEGARQAAQAHGFKLQHLPVRFSEGGMIEPLASSAQPIDGVIAASDTIAMMALHQLHALGKSVPKDVQLIGFDDLPMARLTNPPLSTIRQDIAGGAAALVERLRARIERRRAESLVMTPRLIVRETTRPA